MGGKNFQTKRGQEAIAPSEQIHWQKVGKGLAVGYYKFRSEAWYARVFFSGKYYKSNLPNAVDYKSALSAANEYDTKIRSGESNASQSNTERLHGQRITMGELIAEYFELSEKAGEKKRLGADVHKEWRYDNKRRYTAYWSHLDDVPVRAVTAKMIREHRDTQTHLSPDSINRCLAPVKAALQYAATKENPYIDSVPQFKALRRAPKSDRGEYPAIDLETRREVIATAEPSLKAILTAIHMTGCRPVEARRLRVRHVKLGRAPCVQFLHYKGQNASGKERDFPLSGERLEFFKRQAEGRDANDFLFLSETGVPWTMNNLSKAFKLHKRALGAHEDFVTYVFRHMWLTDACDKAGSNPMQIATLAGTSVKFLEQNYYKLGASAISAMPDV